MLRYNLEAEGYAVDTVERGDEAETRLRENVARPGPPRLDAARHFRHRALPAPARARGDALAADHHADRPRRGGGARARARHRRRRLCGQAVLGARADGAGARDPAPLQARADRPRAEGRRPRARPRDPPRPPQRPRAPSRPDRVPPARIPDAAPGRVFTRAQLLDGVWGRDVYVDERTVDVHVGRLRKALGRGRDPIRTVRGSGYSFDEGFAGTA